MSWPTRAETQHRPIRRRRGSRRNAGKWSVCGGFVAGTRSPRAGRRRRGYSRPRRLREDFAGENFVGRAVRNQPQSWRYNCPRSGAAASGGCRTGMPRHRIAVGGLSARSGGIERAIEIDERAMVVSGTVSLVSSHRHSRRPLLGHAHAVGADNDWCAAPPTTRVQPVIFLTNYPLRF